MTRQRCAFSHLWPVRPPTRKDNNILQPPPSRDPPLQGLYGQFDPSVPNGSPLDPIADPRLSGLQGTFAPQAPQSPPQPLQPLPAPVDQQAPMQAPAAPQGLAQAPSLPVAPPSTGTVDRKRYRPFAKENLSETLANISQGFTSHPESFAAGLSGAAQNVSQLRKGYDAFQRKDTAIGGPDNAFEVITDPISGVRSYKPIAAFQGYLTDKARAAKAPPAPTAAENVKLRGQTMAAILKLQPEQQAQAYSDFKADSARLGYNLGLPPEWDPGVATAMAGQTITPTERMTDDRARAAGDRATAAGDRTQANADRTYGLARDRQGLAERKYTSPPSTRKPRSTQQALPSGAVLVN